MILIKKSYLYHRDFLKGIRTLFTYVFLISIFNACSGPEPNIDPPEMWGELKPGSYAVGFETTFLYDISKPSVPYSDWDGKLYATQETKGRQMQLNIWYPAQVTGKDKRLSFEHYINLLARQTDFSALDDDKKAFANEQLIKKINALGANGSFTKTALDSLKNLETYAFLEASPVEEKFPLVVFPNGGSPAFQSIMCEYLASHGFVVVGVALKGQNAFTDEASVRGLETAVSDLNFAILNLLELPQVDKEKVGLIGNAISSSQIIAYQTRNSNVDCVVSLEGGLLSSFEQNLLDKTPFYNTNAVDIPILAVYAPHPAIDPSYIFDLKYADRYFYHFRQMTEFHFLNFGQLDRYIPNIIGKHEGDVQKGHELASLYVLKFLETFLQEKQKSKRFLEGSIAKETKKHIDTSFVKKAIPKMPDITSIKNEYSTSGFIYIDSLYKSHKKFDSEPFNKNFFSEMKDWLAWQKDPEHSARYQLYKLAYDSYPNSAEINYYLSYFALQTRHQDESQFHGKKMLEILKKNNNPELTIARKEQLKSSLRQFSPGLDRP